MRLTHDAEGFEVEADPSDLSEIASALGGLVDRSDDSDDEREVPCSWCDAVGNFGDIQMTDPAGMQETIKVPVCGVCADLITSEPDPNRETENAIREAVEDDAGP